MEGGVSCKDCELAENLVMNECPIWRPFLICQALKTKLHTRFNSSAYIYIYRILANAPFQHDIKKYLHASLVGHYH